MSSYDTEVARAGIAERLARAVVAAEAVLSVVVALVAHLRLQIEVPLTPTILLFRGNYVKIF